jgi:hypothetical protein
MGSRQGRATSAPANHAVIGEALYGKVEIAAVSSTANVSYLAVDIRVFLIKGRLRYRSRCGKNLTCRVARCGTADVRLWGTF